ncbi:MAG: hypothetical protein CVU63_11355 [Deltaproteobacteria bacterium HGW-Deltaproteobacteria-20]|jgi:hypothetical protein|nr:MAG: hypothetical protein CVU63_11355 [Deltaproteobacteria bacterium HGW-Deltaproteobacteria-20]
MQPGMMPPPYAPQPNLEHLRLLSIFHYVMGGIVGVFSLFPIIHLGMGIAIVSGALPTAGSGPPAVMGWTFIIIGGTVIFFGETLAICTLLAGRYLSTRQAWLFCVIVAAANCLNMPFGTVLGVFTILMLLKPEVKALFFHEPTV